jgi:hypothetical protein
VQADHDMAVEVAQAAWLYLLRRFLEQALTQYLLVQAAEESLETVRALTDKTQHLHQ